LLNYDNDDDDGDDDDDDDGGGGDHAETDILFIKTTKGSKSLLQIAKT